MKVNLVIGQPDQYRPGYLNVDPLAEASREGVVKGDVFDLSHSLDAGEAEEIVAMGLLHYLPRAQYGQALAQWASKLAHGGRLTVSVLNLVGIAHSLVDGKLSVDDTARLLYGPQESNWDYIKSGHASFTLSLHMINLGLEIQSKTWEGHYAIVTAVRP